MSPTITDTTGESRSDSSSAVNQNDVIIGAVVSGLILFALIIIIIIVAVRKTCRVPSQQGSPERTTESERLTDAKEEEARDFTSQLYPNRSMSRPIQEQGADNMDKA